MTAMTLLRAMSAIDPKDIEAAYRATGVRMTFAASSPVLTTEEAEPAEFSMPYPKPVSAGKRYAVGGWAAAAACIALVAAAGLYFRSNDDNLTTPSGSEWVVELTGTSPAETVPTQGTDGFLAGSAETVTVPAVTVPAVFTAPAEAQTTGAGTESPEMSSAPAETDNGIPVTTADEGITAGAETTTAATTSDAYMITTTTTSDPWDFLTSNGVSGRAMLALSNGRPKTQEDIAFKSKIVDDPDEIRAFLDRQDPAVTFGQDDLTDAQRSQIMENPIMIYVSWPMDDDSWTSCGVSNSMRDSRGVLDLTFSMYSSGKPAHQEPWIYEAALICKKDTIPAISDISFDLKYYQGTDDPDDEQYTVYLASIYRYIFIYASSWGDGLWGDNGSFGFTTSSPDDAP